LFDSQYKYVVRGMCLAIAGIVFVTLAMPTHFLGDGYAYLANVGSSTGHWTKWSEAGADFAVMTVQSLVGSPSESAALLSFQIISVVSGLVSIWFYFLIAEILTEDAWKRLVILGVLLFSSSILLYFGYVESYPVVWGPVTGLLYFGLRRFIRGDGLMPALLLLLISVWLHLQMLMYVPGALYLLFGSGKGKGLFLKYHRYMWTLGGLVTIGACYYAFHFYSLSLSVQDLFLLPFSGKPSYPDYGMFHPRHLVDIANLGILLYPALPVLAVFAFPIRKGVLTDPLVRFLGALSAGSLLFLIVVDPSLAMPRDWDLFALCGLAPALLLVRLCSVNTNGLARKLGLPVVILSFVGIMSFLLVNLSQERSVAQIKQIIANNPERSLGSMIILSSYFQKSGQMEQDDSLQAQMQETHPEYAEIKSAFDLLAARRPAEAYAVFSRVKPDNYSKQYHSFLAGYYLMVGRPADGLREAKLAVELQRTFAYNYSTLAYAYLANGEGPKAIQALRDGLRLDNHDKEMLSGMALLHYGSGNSDSALFYSEKLLLTDPNSSIALFIKAESYYLRGDLVQARREAEAYLKQGVSDAGYAKNCDDLRKLMPGL
jgi:Flp pilus assembly protein TadD